MSRRVVVTGVGLLSPLGIGTEASWEAIRSGQERHRADHRSSTPPPFPAGSPARSRASIPPTTSRKKKSRRWGASFSSPSRRRSSPCRTPGLKVTPENAEQVGVYIGSGIGGFEVIEREHKTLLEHGPRRISPFFIPATIINLASGYVSIRTGAKGPNSATATACTTSAHSIGDSFRIIQRGDADVMICGGTEAASRRWASADSPPCARCPRATTSPQRASRPWDQRSRRIRGGRRRGHPGARRTGIRQARAARRFWPKWWATG